MSTFEYLDLDFDREQPTLVRADTAAEAADAMTKSMLLLVAHPDGHSARQRTLTWHRLLRWMLSPKAEIPRYVTYYHAAECREVWEEKLGALTQQPAIFLSSLRLPLALDDRREVFERWARMLDEQVNQVEVAQAGPWGELVDKALEQDAAAFQRAIERRNWLIANERWLTSEDIVQTAPGKDPSLEEPQCAYHLRCTRQITGVLHQCQRLHPEAQFAVIDGRLAPLRVMAALLELLPADESGWTQAFWLFQPTGRLDGARPADVLATRPEEVLLAAKMEFCGDNGI